MNLIDRQATVAPVNVIRAAFGQGPYRATNSSEFTRDCERWVVTGPVEPQSYEVTWSVRFGDESVIAKGLTEAHARIFARALNQQWCEDQARAAEELREAQDELERVVGAREAE